MMVWGDSEVGLVKEWCDGVPVEKEAQHQIERVAALPFVKPWVAVMPDVHVGAGATIGSVIPTQGVLIPAAVGVDIGCGMRAVKIACTVDDICRSLGFGDLRRVRERIESVVPHGRTDNGGPNDRGAWGKAPFSVQSVWEHTLADRYEALCELDPEMRHKRPVEQLGTLGTGNHFIELCVSAKGETWLVLHSGSRGPGARIASVSIRKAKDLMDKFYIKLEDKALSYLPQGTVEFNNYVSGLYWALDYAKENRKLMMNHIIKELEVPIFPASLIDCHHNFAAYEKHFGKKLWITRKGATRAGEGEYGIIPGSMGAKSYIVRGKGNRESFESCSHGAGRVMARKAAMKAITIEDHLKATKGVECRKDAEVLDESPAAYKDIDLVMKAQEDLVEIEETLKQVVCVKG